MCAQGGWPGGACMSRAQRGAGRSGWDPTASPCHSALPHPGNFSGWAGENLEEQREVPRQVTRTCVQGGRIGSGRVSHSPVLEARLGYPRSTGVCPLPVTCPPCGTGHSPDPEALPACPLWGGSGDRNTTLICVQSPCNWAGAEEGTW